MTASFTEKLDFMELRSYSPATNGPWPTSPADGGDGRPVGGRRHQRGQQFQRDDSYDRYWMNASTGAHAGGDITFGDTQLRELGLDPSNHEEAKILR